MGRSPCCSKVGLNRGAWTALEDKILKDYIRIHGEGKWRNLPKKAGLKRCGKSCRLRWLNYLRPDIKRGNITHDEEELIVRLHKLLGNRWSLIAGRLPGRTDNEIKNYWNTTLGKKVQGTMLNTWSPNQICNSSKDKKKSAMEASSLLPPPPAAAAAAAPSPNMESRVIRTKALRCNRVILPPQELDPAAYMNEEHNVNCQISQEGSSEAFFIPTSGDNPDDMLDINVGDFCFKDLLFDTDLTQLCHLDGGNGTEGGLDCNINNNSASKELSPCSDLEPLPYPDDEMLKDWTGNNCIQPDAGSDLRSLASFLDSDDDWLREQ